MLVTSCYENRPINTAQLPVSSKILIAYYAATALFLVLDFAFGFNVRLAFLEALPAARIAYYGVCFACMALMIWRPAWTVLISAFESLVTLAALIIGTGMRVLLVSDRVLETGSGYVTLQEITNFLLAGGVAYIAWVNGIKGLKSQNWS